jgi:predicted dehydrogenase
MGAAVSLLPAAWLSGAENKGKQITLALVGCAHIHTPGFVNLLKGRHDVRVKYVWDWEPQRAAKRAGELGSKAVNNLEEVWADAEVAGVVICSETNRHLSLVQEAAKARKHMFVEKPLGITARESYTMADAIQKNRLLFTTGYFMRTDPKHLFLKEQVELKNFGKVTRVRGSNCHSGSLGGWFDSEWRWMAEPRIAGVGAFGDLGTHSLDLMMWLVGEVSAVSADIKVVTKRYGDCDECGEALIQFKNGIIGTLAAGWVDVDNPVTLELCGTEGHAVIVDGELRFKSAKVQGADGKDAWTKLPPAQPAPLHQFVDAVAGREGLPLVTPAEAAARVSVMQAMYRASRQHRWVRPA